MSDFGHEDVFVGVCRAVVRRIAPEADVLDLTHGIPPQDVLAGALALADALPYVEPGVHLAVVDPGVGGVRRAVALAGGGRLYVGPDNGLLTLAADALGGVERAVELTSPAHRLEPVSRTFHGRDVFAPAAAHLARGVPLEELGPPVEPESLVRLELPPPSLAEGSARATVVGVDRHGNLSLNLRPGELDRAVPARELTVAGSPAVRGASFGDAAPGDLVVLADSSGRVSVARNGGSAAELLGAGRGAELDLAGEA